jgi:putative transposase
MGLLKPVFLEVLREQESKMQDLAFMFYTKELTTRDISQIFEDIYGKSFSSSSVSNIIIFTSGTDY